MIYIYGDSHANKCLRGLTIPYIDCHQSSITMHRVGRDNKILKFNSELHDDNSILCFVYGEVDCRCHIRRQIDSGRDEDAVIEELVQAYFKTLYNNIKSHRKIIVFAVIPPTKRNDHETVHGPIKHAFPFVGNDEDRSRYTNKVNKLINIFCSSNGYIYFDPFYYYTREDGTLKFELTDKTVHIYENSVIIEKFIELYKNITNIDA